MAPSPNWPQIISDLQAKGWTQERIAREIKVSQALISQLKNFDDAKSKGPSYVIGAALLALHVREVVGSRRKADALKA